MKRPRRRLIRLSIRGLMALVVVIAAGLEWVREARVQRDAVNAIDSNFGMVEYEWDHRYDRECPRLSAWRYRLMDALGKDYFGSVTNVVYMGHEECGPVRFEPIAKLKNLESLNLSDRMISDSDLNHLIPLRKLRELDLSGNNITDEGIGHLKAMPGLRWLDVYNTKASKAAITELRRINKLLEIEHN